MANEHGSDREHEEVSQWIASLTSEDAATSASDTKAVKKAGPKASATSKWTDYYSHIYLAEHLSKEIAEDLVRMVDGEYAVWMRYDGKGVWIPTTKEEAAALVLNHLRAEYERAVESKEPARVEAASRACRTISNARDVLAASTILLSKPKSEFDSNPHLRVVGNGVYDMEHDRLEPHAPALYLTKRMSRFDYVEGFTDENFSKLLDSVEDDIKPWLQWGLFGSAITSFKAPNKLFIFDGEKRAGKTKLVQLVKRVAGEHSRRLLRDILTGDKQFAISDIEGFALLTVDELNEDGLFLKNGKVKALVRTDEVSSDKKGMSYVEFRMFGTIVATSNGNPKILDLDAAGADRLVSVPCLKKYVPADEYAALKDDDPMVRPQDPMLEVKITAEDPSLYMACLSWLLKGGYLYTSAYLEQGRELDLEYPASVRIHTDDWLKNDEFSMWMDTWTVEEKGKFILGYDAYDQACQQDFVGTSLKLSGWFQRLKTQNGRFPLTKVLDRTTITDATLSQWTDPVKEAQSKKSARYDQYGQVVSGTDTYKPRELETPKPRYVIMNRRWKTSAELQQELPSAPMPRVLDPDEFEWEVEDIDPDDLAAF